MEEDQKYEESKDDDSDSGPDIEDEIQRIQRLERLESIRDFQKHLSEDYRDSHRISRISDVVRNSFNVT